LHWCNHTSDIPEFNNYLNSCPSILGSNKGNSKILQGKFEEIIGDFEINDMRIKLVISDNAANIKCAIQNADYLWSLCIIHLLNLLIHSTIFNIQESSIVDPIFLLQSKLSNSVNFPHFLFQEKSKINRSNLIVSHDGTVSTKFYHH
jgi:hypothetical protein